MLQEREQKTVEVLSFRAPPELAQRVERAADKELISVAAWCRRAVSRAIESEQVSA